MPQTSKTKFRISGRVIDRKTRRGIAGLRVEAWDKDLIFHDLIGSAVTDAQGAFRIEFDESYFKEIFLDRLPVCFSGFFVRTPFSRAPRIQYCGIYRQERPRSSSRW
jgi:hypothetical protein